MRLALSIISILFTWHTHAQVIRGEVVDSELETPIIGAQVFVLGNDSIKPVVSDLDGHFSISVPLGRHDLLVRSIGYEVQTIPNILVTSGKETALRVLLVEKISEMNEVVVTAETEKDRPLNQMATVSARTFSVEEASRYAGSFNDPARMAQSYAGVSSNNDQSNEIVIRGNSPRGVLWKVEGVEVPSPSHFAGQGASGGAISMLSAQMMANSEFYTGAFPADQGNALSGVFDVRLRKGNYRKHEHAVELGVLGANLASEGPFKKGYNGSYLINYRYSALTILEAIGFQLVGDAIPAFQDLSYNVYLPTKNAGTFTLFGIGGISRVEEEWEQDSAFLTNAYKTDLMITGLTHRIPIKKNMVLQSAIAYTITRNSYKENATDENGTDLYVPVNTNFVNGNARALTGITWKPNGKNMLRTGVIASMLGYDYLYRFYVPDDSTYRTEQDSRGQTFSFQAYATWKHRFTETFSIISGVHYLHLFLNGSNAVEPRLGLEWRIREQHQITLGFGLHSRVEDLSVYRAYVKDNAGNRIYPNESIGFTKAAHAVLGYDLRIGPEARLKTEVYYQYIYGVPVSDTASSFSGLNFDNGFTTEPLVNEGEGFNYGIEITLEKFFSNNWFALFTGSLFESKYRGADEVLRDTRYNGNYSVSLNGGKEFLVGKEKQHAIGMSFRGTLAGGRRYSPILLEESMLAGFTVSDETRAFEAQFQDYFRIDVQLYFRRNKKKTTGTWKLDIQNATNRLNTQNIFYDASYGGLRESTQLGIVPVLSYKLEF